MLLVGQLNYGKRGILDITHTRCSRSERFSNCSSRVASMSSTRVAFQHRFHSPSVSRLAECLITINGWLIRLRATMFSYQSLFVVQARPGLSYRLQPGAPLCR
jgi:hypothetical protein